MYNLVYLIVEGSECTKKAVFPFAPQFTFKSVINFASRATRFSHERVIARHTLRRPSFDAESDRSLLQEIEQVTRSLDFNAKTHKRFGRRGAVDKCSILDSGILTLKRGSANGQEIKTQATETVETRFKQLQEDWMIRMLSHIFRVEYLIKR